MDGVWPFEAWFRPSKNKFRANFNQNDTSWFLYFRIVELMVFSDFVQNLISLIFVFWLFVYYVFSILLYFDEITEIGFHNFMKLRKSVSLFWWNYGNWFPIGFPYFIFILLLKNMIDVCVATLAYWSVKEI